MDMVLRCKAGAVEGAMKHRVPREMVIAGLVTLGIIAGLVTLGIIAGAVTGAQGATHVAVTRVGKGILNPHPIAVDEQLGRVFIANPSHSARSVSVLAASSGRLLYSVPVSMFPMATAVDEQSQRVFVAGSVSDVTQPGSV